MRRLIEPAFASGHFQIYRVVRRQSCSRKPSFRHAGQSGSVLVIDIALAGSTGVRSETVTDANTTQIVSYSINMQGQGQNWAYFEIEQWYGRTIKTPVIFSNTTITCETSNTPNWCSSYQAANRNMAQSSVLSTPSSCRSSRRESPLRANPA